LVAVWAMTTVDGVVPPVPSETLVVAVAVASVAGDGPPVLLLVLVAALGALCGDLLAYAIGRGVPVRRLRLFRTPRGAAGLDWAQQALESRGASFVIAGRFVPVGRVAVNMTAGATGFPLRRFLPAIVVAGLLWSCYTTLLGVSAGVFLGRHPLVAMVVGAATGLAVGVVVDSVSSRRLRRPPA
jgi:membrane-associated protein